VPAAGGLRGCEVVEGEEGVRGRGWLGGQARAELVRVLVQSSRRAELRRASKRWPRRWRERRGRGPGPPRDRLGLTCFLSSLPPRASQSQCTLAVQLHLLASAHPARAQHSPRPLASPAPARLRPVLVLGLATTHPSPARPAAHPQGDIARARSCASRCAQGPGAGPLPPTAVRPPLAGPPRLHDPTLSLLKPVGRATSLPRAALRPSASSCGARQPGSSWTARTPDGHSSLVWRHAELAISLFLCAVGPQDVVLFACYIRTCAISPPRRAESASLVAIALQLSRPRSASCTACTACGALLSSTAISASALALCTVCYECEGTCREPVERRLRLHVRHARRLRRLGGCFPASAARAVCVDKGARQPRGSVRELCASEQGSGASRGGESRRAVFPFPCVGHPGARSPSVRRRRVERSRDHL